MQIGSFAAGEGTHALQVFQAGAPKAEIGQAEGQPQRPEEGEQLAAGLGGELAAADLLLQPQLHQDAEAHLLAMQMAVAGLQLGEAVVHRMGRHGAAAGPADPPDQAGREPTGLRHAHPGLSIGIRHRLLAFEQQLIAQGAGHLHRLLHQAIVAGAAAHRGLIPLGHRIGDAAGQRAGGRLSDQIVVEHQQGWAAVERHIAAEGSLGRVEIGQRRPARAGGSAARHRGAGQLVAMGQQLAGIQHLAATDGDHRIAALSAQVLGEGCQILLAAVPAQTPRQGADPARLQ